MKSMRAIICLFLLVTLVLTYGIVSNLVFNRPTFLSKKVPCGQNLWAYGVAKETMTGELYKGIFGKRCY